jgi:hypothetical protein
LTDSQKAAALSGHKAAALQNILWKENVNEAKCFFFSNFRKRKYKYGDF